MQKVKIFSTKKVQTELTLPKNIFGVKVNDDLLSQALRVYEDRIHPALAKVKRRGDVNISTRKIYRQKGTGGARHGAKSAPIFVGGGVAHGPEGVKRILSFPRKMKKTALNMAMSYVLKEGRVFGINLTGIQKTKDASEVLEKIRNVSEAKTFLLLFSKNNIDSAKYLRNIKGVSIGLFENANAYKVIYTQALVLDKDIFVSQKKKSL